MQSFFFFLNFLYLVNFTKSSSSQKVEEQISLIQCWMIFKSLKKGKKNPTGFNKSIWARKLHSMKSNHHVQKHKCQQSVINRLGLTVNCLHYLFSSALECEGCAPSPDAPALPGSQLLPINDLSTQKHKELQCSYYKERSSSKPTCTQPTTAVLNINGWLAALSVGDSSGAYSSGRQWLQITSSMNRWNGLEIKTKCSQLAWFKKKKKLH